MNPSRVIEAMLLMATEPLGVTELADGLEIPEVEVVTHLREIADFYRRHERGMALHEIAGGWRLATADDVAPVIEEWLVADQRSRLSQAALETLAVVAYLQPVTRGRIAGVRGVGVDGVVRTLLVRGLIIEAGEDEVTGAMRFATTPLFLQKLGLKSLEELPDLAPLLPDAVALEAELRQFARQESENERHE